MVVGDRFEWDDAKAAANYAKHGVKFEVAQEIFDDPLNVTIVDLRHWYREELFVKVGLTTSGEILVVGHVERGARIRIIHARSATSKERRDYMEKKTMEIRDEDYDDLLPEYDFSKGVRGKYAPGRLVIHMRIDADVARYFPTSVEVNAALRQLIAEGRAPEPRED